MKLGDCFRLGSVGVVVSEMRIRDGEEQRLDSKTLQYLKDEALTLEGKTGTSGQWASLKIFELDMKALRHLTSSAIKL